MKKTALLLLPLLLFAFAASVQADLRGKVRDLRQKLKQSSKEPDTETVVAGLKEALSVGAEKAVKSVSRRNGYFENAEIRIPLPEKAQKAAKVMKKVGMRKQVDEFVLSMNRAAEKAAPRAKKLFIGAVRQMTFQDARKILRGNDTAATDYLKARTAKQLYDDFRPLVASAMHDVGVTRKYQRMMSKAAATRLVKPESVDLDHYVTNKALDGLFHMVGQEERKIRKDPAARVTELLKKVFAKQ